MLRKFLASAKTHRTNVHPITRFTYRVCAFYSDGMREVAHARVALNLQTWFVDSYNKITQTGPREKYDQTKRSMGVAWAVTHFVFHPADARVSDGRPSWPVTGNDNAALNVLQNGRRWRESRLFQKRLGALKQPNNEIKVVEVDSAKNSVGLTGCSTHPRYSRYV